jgi:hypothetical protein
MTQPAILAPDFPILDWVVINGDKSPGQVRILGANSPRGWDERQGYALTGATLVPKGDPLGKFTMRFEFWDPADYPLWEAYAAKYFDKSVRFMPGSIRPRALGIQHPQLTCPPIRIVQCVVEDADGIEGDDYGGWSCQIYMKQYRRPKPALSRPDAAFPAVSQGLPTAQDQQDVETNRLTTALQSAPNNP